MYLIADFSRRGNNYRDGNNVNLPVETRINCQENSKSHWGEFFVIGTAQPYLKDFKEVTEIAKKELTQLTQIRQLKKSID